MICEHGDIDLVEREDPLLPDYIVILECQICGMFAEYDTIENELA